MGNKIIIIVSPDEAIKIAAALEYAGFMSGNEEYTALVEVVRTAYASQTS